MPRQRVHVVDRTQSIPRPLDEVWQFFATARNLEAITPPFLRFRVLGAPGALHEGAQIRYALRLHGVPLRWLTRIAAWEPPHRFVDVQVRGPYALWHHTHEFAADGQDRTLMRDRVLYRVPLGALGAAAHVAFVRRDLRRIFDYRAAEVARRMGV